MRLKYMYITNDVQVASIAQKYGVDRIWIDLETLGKEERQKGMNTVKSNHTIDDIKKVRPVVTTSELLVRVNPINPDSENEINKVIEAGADMIMLPMWKSLEDVQTFLKFVNGRVKTTLLLETKEAVDCVVEVLDNCKIDEIHIGLNDLHLSYGLKFMFELLANGTVEMLCNKFKAHNLPYGFGGIAKLGGGTLPAEKVIMEHFRLGSTRAILSRSFCNTSIITDIDEIEKTISTNIKELNDYQENLSKLNSEDFKKNHDEVIEIVNRIVDEISSKEN